MRRIFRLRLSTDGSERGAALVEAALILPLFVALVLGLITFGDAYFTRISIEDAVRDGARFGATMQTFDETTVKDRVADLSGGELNASDVCAAKIEVADLSGDTTCGVDTPDGAVAEGKEIIKVSASTTGEIQAVFFSWDITLDAGAVSRYERSA